MHVSVVVTRYNEPDELLARVLQGLAHQEFDGRTCEVRLYDQQGSDTLRRLCATLSSSSSEFCYCEAAPLPLSVTRNRGIRESASDLVLLLDADAIPAPNWIAEMRAALDTPATGIVGSRVVPLWESREFLFARAARLRAYYSIFDHGPQLRETAWVIGASFGLHRERVPGPQFLECLGRTPGSLRSGEDIELCLRARRAGLRVLYVGTTAVEHAIAPARASLRWMAPRIVAAGRQRASLGPVPGGLKTPANRYDLLFAPLIVPLYLAGYVTAPRRSTVTPSG
jgi:cellulose synthase/poly-beta-1,6-N-acetylglucosamine synthase-like glycosyltransferase